MAQNASLDGLMQTAINGRKSHRPLLSGVVVGDTVEALTLGTTSGEPVVVAKTRIESMAVSAVSVMPEGILKALSAQELRDLLTYLLLPRPCVETYYWCHSNCYRSFLPSPETGVSTIRWNLKIVMVAKIGRAHV